MHALAVLKTILQDTPGYSRILQVAGLCLMPGTSVVATVVGNPAMEGPRTPVG